MSIAARWLNTPKVALLLGDEVGPREKIRLGEPLGVELVIGSATHTLIVPEGFACDGASIPRFAWTVIGHPLRSRYVRSAILHDYLCYRRWFRSDDVHRIFHATLRADRVSRVQAWLMYQAVARFGPQFEAGGV